MTPTALATKQNSLTGTAPPPPLSTAPSDPPSVRLSDISSADDDLILDVISRAADLEAFIASTLDQQKPPLTPKSHAALSSFLSSIRRATSKLRDGPPKPSVASKGMATIANFLRQGDDGEEPSDSSGDPPSPPYSGVTP
jgi:hypothetical protein